MAASGAAQAAGARALRVDLGRKDGGDEDEDRGDDDEDRRQRHRRRPRPAAPHAAAHAARVGLAATLLQHRAAAAEQPGTALPLPPTPTATTARPPSECLLATVKTLVPVAEARDQRRKRKPIDLVAVVDTSGSMAGDAEILLRDSLRFLVQQLCAQDLKPEKPEQDQNTDDDECAVEGDRLAIVSFSDNACVQMPLTRMDARGKAKAEAAIAKTRAFGGTNLSAGVFRGLDLIESRKRGNQRLASVLVLTDGLANRGVLDASRVAAGVKAALQRINTPTSLFAFGIGSTHDADGLVEMTRASAGGVYAYLSGAEMIPHTLEKCLGGLVSVVAQNVRLHFNPRLWTPLAPWRAQQPGMLSVGDMYMSEEKHLVLVRRADAPPSSQHASSLSSSPEGPTADGVDPAENVYIEYLDVATMAPQTVCTRARPPPTHNDANRAVMQVASICNLALALQAMNSVAAGPSMMQSVSARDAKPAPSVLDTSLAAIRASTAFTSGDPVSGSLVDHLEALLSQENANDPGRRHALLSLSNQYEAQRVLSTSFTAGAGATPGNQRRLPEDDSCEDASSLGPAAVAASTAASTAAAAAADLAQHRCPQAQTLPVASAIPSCEMAATLDAVSGYASSSRTLAHGDLGPRASELSFSLDRSSRTALPLMADLGIELPMARTVQRDETDAFTTSTAGRDDRVGSVRTSASSASADSEVSTVSTTSSVSSSTRASRWRRSARRHTSPTNLSRASLRQPGQQPPRERGTVSAIRQADVATSDVRSHEASSESQQIGAHASSHIAQPGNATPGVRQLMAFFFRR